MAISNLLPRKAKGSHSRKQTLQARLTYDQKEEKTDGGKLITSYMCSPETAAEEFEASKLLYQQITGRSQPKDRDIIAYRIIQSFKPGEITPEEAHKLGYELAMKFTRGCHQFVVSTHTDKSHIHNHIEFNSTNLNSDGKFNNVKDSARALQKLNDRICREHGYSVIEDTKKKGQTYTEKAAAKQGRSFKEHLRQTIERVLPGCKDLEEFLSRMRNEGYEVKHRGKSLEFRAPGQLKFTRSYRLGNGYDEAGLRERIAGKAAEQLSEKRSGKTNQAVPEKKVNLLIDIQAKIQSGKGKGYERWAAIFNLKEAAKTLNFLTEQGVTDYDELIVQTKEAGKKFDALSARIKQLEGRMAQTAQLKMHIINYSKTKDVYAAYKKSGKKEAFLNEHKEEIKKHETAKAAFEALKGKPIPKVAQLSKEYTSLLAEKKEAYEEFKQARKTMVEYQTAKDNVDRILGTVLLEKELEKKKESPR